MIDTVHAASNIAAEETNVAQAASIAVSDDMIFGSGSQGFGAIRKP